MPIGERIKRLRKEARSSQGELAERVSTDARHISRYENGGSPLASTPSRASPKHPTSASTTSSSTTSHAAHSTPADALGDRLAAIGELTDDDVAVLRSSSSLVAKSRLRTFTADIS